MSKTEVCSWRLDADLKRRLEAAAHEEKTSIGALKWIGSIRGDDPTRSERVKESFHQYVLEKHKRRASKRSDSAR
jgi:hypothetical protein